MSLALDITTANPALSNASKMPCKSWSLEAGSTCPGQFDKTGTIDPVCSDCYAQKGRYVMDNVAAVRIHNRQDWKAPDWTDMMVQVIGRRPMFRWFDSGDCYALELAHKIYEVMKRTPNTKHWFPTRMGRFAKFQAILKAMHRLDNVVVRHSAFGYDRKPTNKIGSMVYRDKAAPASAHACPAYQTKAGSCRKANCFACWDKEVKLIAYPGH